VEGSLPEKLWNEDKEWKKGGKFNNIQIDASETNSQCFLVEHLPVD
jgi:hypothetical protein